MRYKVGLSDTKRRRSTNRRRTPKRAGVRSVSFSNLTKFKKVSSGLKSRTAPYKKRGRKGKKLKGKNANLVSQVKKWAYIFTGLGVFVGLIGAIGIGIYLKGLQASLPDPDKLLERSSDQSTKIYDRNGKLLYTVYEDENREFIKIEDIPEQTKWALLAAEDVEFYQHKGVDLPGIARSAYLYFTSGEVKGGGSTVSQQLVKNTLLTDFLGAEEAYSQKISRKIKEILITMQMEQNLTKDEILQLYMNEIALGGVNYGFQAASKSYFGKDVKDINLAESAMLAGIIPAPGIYSPLFGTNPELAKEQQEAVLDNMLKYKDLTGVTEEEIKEAREYELVYKGADVDIPAPHFVFYVRSLLDEQYGPDVVARGGLKVITSIDMSMQKIGEEEVIKGVAQHGAKYGVSNGAMIAIDPETGEILTMVGSIDYNNVDDPKIDGNVNITISERQMGSSVKPYTYLTAFEQGYGPWLLTPDISQLTFGGYKPMNWDDKFYGLMTAREALVKSRNIPAIYTTQLVGVDAFIQTAQKMGITTLTDRSSYGLSIALGAGEMKLLEHTVGFTVFANEGIKKDAIAILKVQDNQGEVLFEQETQKGKRVFDEQEIYVINWALCDLGSFGDQPFYNSYKYNGKRAFCGKTGTTNGPRDLVAMMYHKNLVVGVWAGNNNNVETPGAWSTTVPLPIASAFMTRVAGEYPPERFSRPSGILATSVCNDTGATPSKNSGCKKVSSLYISGQAPPQDKRQTLQVCKANDLIPTNLDAAKKYDLVKNVTLMNKTLENTFQQGAYNKFLGKIDSITYLYKKPEEGDCALPLGPDNAPVVGFLTPSAASSFGAGDDVDITVDVRALGNVDNVKYYFDGSLVDTVDTAPFSTTYTIPGGTSAGAHSFSATVTDDVGKTGSASLAITVSSGVSVSMDATPDGGLPMTLSASTSGSPDQVEFRVEKEGGGFSTTLVDANGADGWSKSLASVGAGGSGTYNITAVATKGGVTYASATIQVAITI